MYYAAKQKRLQSPAKSSSKLYNNGYDDEEYNYKVHENELFNDRYIIDKRIGKGSFGQVVRAYDRKIKKHVAIKIIKSRKPFTKQAQTEINLLEFLNRKDPEDKWFIGPSLPSRSASARLPRHALAPSPLKPAGAAAARPAIAQIVWPGWA